MFGYLEILDDVFLKASRASVVYCTGTPNARRLPGTASAIYLLQLVCFPVCNVTLTKLKVWLHPALAPISMQLVQSVVQCHCSISDCQVMWNSCAWTGVHSTDVSCFLFC